MSFEGKKISIVVPIYNAKEYLRNCLESIINQTYKNLQIICVDDGSSDGSVSILEEIQSKDDRVVFIQQKNQGVSAARNYGLSIANGEYIMFVDADDWIDKRTCEIAINTVNKNKCDVVIWNYHMEFGKTSQEKFVLGDKGRLYNEYEVKEKLQRRLFGLYKSELKIPETADSLTTVWGKLYKISIIKNNHIEFTDLKEIGSCEDGLFNIDFFGYVNKACYITDCLYHYRKGNSSSISSSYRKDLFVQWNKLFDYMQKYIDQNNCPYEYQLALYNRISMSVLSMALVILLNDKTEKERIRELNDILCDERYINANKHLEIKYFPLIWKPYYFLVKHRHSTGVYIFVKIIDSLMKKRYK